MHDIILITLRNRVTEHDSIGYSSTIIIESIRHFIWITTDIIILT